jgi:hypothetical protein
MQSKIRLVFTREKVVAIASVEAIRLELVRLS